MLVVLPSKYLKKNSVHHIIIILCSQYTADITKIHFPSSLLSRSSLIPMIILKSRIKHNVRYDERIKCTFYYKCGFHHLIHKTKQGVHKGKNINGIHSRLGWSLTAIYFATFLLPSPVKIFEAPATLRLSFLAAPKKILGRVGTQG